MISPFEIIDAVVAWASERMHWGFYVLAVAFTVIFNREYPVFPWLIPFREALNIVTWHPLIGWADLVLGNISIMLDGIQDKYGIPLAPLSALFSVESVLFCVLVFFSFCYLFRIWPFYLYCERRRIFWLFVVVLLLGGVGVISYGIFQDGAVWLGAGIAMCLTGVLWFRLHYFPSLILAFAVAALVTLVVEPANASVPMPSQVAYEYDTEKSLHNEGIQEVRFLGRGGGPKRAGTRSTTGPRRSIGSRIKDTIVRTARAARDYVRKRTQNVRRSVARVRERVREIARPQPGQASTASATKATNAKAYASSARSTAESVTQTTPRSLQTRSIKGIFREIGVKRFSALRELRATRLEARLQRKGQLVQGGGLRVHEALGGHTISRHVSQSVSAMRSRASKQVPSVSTYRTRSSAERFISSAIRSNQKLIGEFVKGDGKVFQFEHKFTEVTGIGVTRSSTRVLKLQSVRVVLRKDVKSLTGYKILTSFPI